MVLALDYVQRTKQDLPDLVKRARENIAIGYRRLLGFEVKSEPGGFDWWGKPPANLFLTAYGLTSFRDLSEVHPVDPELLPRIRAWLLARQQADGSWKPEGRQGWSTDMARGQAYCLTAYIAWGLARAGQTDAKALAWLERESAAQKDPYALALGALALGTSNAASTTARALTERLARASTKDPAGRAWRPQGETGIGARGDSAAIETTALAVQALLQGGHVGVAHEGLERLLAWRSPNGSFGTTQSTILALKALLAADAGPSADEPARVGFALGGKELAGTTLSPASTVPFQLDLPRGGADRLVLTQSGGGRTRATLATTTWVPWEEATPRRGRLDLDVRWPMETLAVGQRAFATVTVKNRSPKERASVVTLEVGIPPGCDAEPKDVEGEGAEHVERGETALVIYLRDLAPGAARTFRIGFRPRYALEVVTAPSKAYEYYVPEEAVDVAPMPVKARR